MRLNQVTVTVLNIELAISFYRKLGLRPIVISPHYARFVCPQGDATFSVHVGEIVAAQTTVVYFETDEIDQTVARLKTAGIVFDTDPIDEPWLWREARLRDPFGNRLCLFSAGVNRLAPPWKIKE